MTGELVPPRERGWVVLETSYSTVENAFYLQAVCIVQARLSFAAPDCPQPGSAAWCAVRPDALSASPSYGGAGGCATLRTARVRESQRSGRPSSWRGKEAAGRGRVCVSPLWDWDWDGDWDEDRHGCKSGRDAGAAI